ncbi:glyoxalase [Solihabitans fulvus]|uniref:Glyoxalase n=1 Tax=Solihabitans fulvus TaxID=1892852 RepID=A0A5B2WXP4_9PSEU|nr:VOC family protein [Solihabitans fulvus]KAA2256733.1 glyoxalase [Solihabitans fulvus]
MTEGVSAIIYPVKDLATAKVLFGELLGVQPHTDESYYVGYKVGALDVGLDPHGHGKGMTGPVGYWQVEDINASVKALVEAGGTVGQEPKDVGGGKLIGTVTDTDGNTIGLIQQP